MTLPHLPLRDLPIGALRLVKETVLHFGDQDHTRWVFRVPRRCRVLGSRTACYAKVWNPTYVRRDNILRAIDAGFYDQDTTPALAALIVHQNVCRGYLTTACRPSYLLDPAYYNAIKERTRTTGLFNVQFSPYHVMKLGRKSTLIDLEGVYAVEDVARMPHFHCTFDDPDYSDFVGALARGERLPDMTTPGRVAHRASMAQVLWRATRNPYRAVQAVFAHHRQRFGSPANRPHHLHLLDV